MGHPVCPYPEVAFAASCFPSFDPLFCSKTWGVTSLYEQARALRKFHVKSTGSGVEFLRAYTEGEGSETR